MTSASFTLEDYFLSIVDFTPEEVRIVASNKSYSAATKFLKKDAPAVALAVLEAAGYTADNSCAGDAVRSLKFQIANDARAAEEAALDKEAEALARTLYADSGFSFENSLSQGQWRAVACKARELHKVEAS